MDAFLEETNKVELDGDKLINEEASEIVCDVDEATPQQIKKVLEG